MELTDLFRVAKDFSETLLLPLLAVLLLVVLSLERLLLALVQARRALAKLLAKGADRHANASRTLGEDGSKTEPGEANKNGK